MKQVDSVCVSRPSFFIDFFIHFCVRVFPAPNTYNESETLTKFEIMDGAPVKGESIPVRLFLGHFDLTPTYRNVHSKFSVKYYINLVIIDEEDRRYFKQQEITLWRRAPARHAPHPRPALPESSAPAHDDDPAKKDSDRS